MGNRAISGELIGLGNRIRDCRKEKHWSQEKLAEEADISLNTVSRIEGGQTRMSIEIFMRLVQALNVDAEVLLFGEAADRGSLDDNHIQFLLRNLRGNEKKIVMQTMEALVESLGECR